MQQPAKLSERAKCRADQLVVDQGLASSKSRAQALIGLGAVVVAGSGAVLDKAGSLVRATTALRLRHQPLPYVSRAAGKLAAAFAAFPWSISNALCLDVGASTGGFTDYLLAHGAASVVALDVGHNQLAYKLREDPRVLVRERCHVVHAADDAVPHPIELVTMDVSFISASQTLPAVTRWLRPRARAVVLVKPQFEVGRRHIERGGIVRDPAARTAALDRVKAASVACGWQVVGSVPSPVHGSKGNQEILLVLERAARGP